MKKNIPHYYLPFFSNSKKTSLIPYKRLLKLVLKAIIIAVSTNTHWLDLTSIIKASQLLSGEIELEKWMTKLMQVILENAGATQGILIFKKNEKLTVEVVATHSSEVN